MRVALETTLQDWLRFEIKKHVKNELPGILLTLPADVQQVIFEFVILEVPRHTVRLYAPVARRSLALRIDTIGDSRVSKLLRLVLSTLDDGSSSFLLSLGMA